MESDCSLRHGGVPCILWPQPLLENPIFGLIISSGTTWQLSTFARPVPAKFSQTCLDMSNSMILFLVESMWKPLQDPIQRWLGLGRFLFRPARPGYKVDEPSEPQGSTRRSQRTSASTGLHPRAAGWLQRAAVGSAVWGRCFGSGLHPKEIGPRASLLVERRVG